MSRRILVTPDQLRGAAAKFREGSESSRQMAAQLGKEVEGLKSQWEGMAQETFYQQFQEWQKQMQRFADLLNGINQQLNDVARNFEEAEKNASRMLQQHRI